MLPGTRHFPYSENGAKIQNWRERNILVRNHVTDKRPLCKSWRRKMSFWWEVLGKIFIFPAEMATPKKSRQKRPFQCWPLHYFDFKPNQNVPKMVVFLLPSAHFDHKKTFVCILMHGLLTQNFTRNPFLGSKRSSEQRVGHHACFVVKWPMTCHCWWGTKDVPALKEPVLVECN